MSTPCDPYLFPGRFQVRPFVCQPSFVESGQLSQLQPENCIRLCLGCAQLTLERLTGIRLILGFSNNLNHFIHLFQRNQQPIYDMRASVNFRELIP